MVEESERRCNSTLILSPAQTARNLSIGGSSTERRDRKKRLQLSCGECRKKKLACDRNLPCKRCVRSGRPEECSFETRTAQLTLSSNLSTQPQSENNSDEIKNLRAEVAQLKELLTQAQQQENRRLSSSINGTDTLKTGEAALLNGNPEEQGISYTTAKTEILDPRERAPRGYYGQHTLFQIFREVPGLFPFIKETADEWLTPLGIHLKKIKHVKDQWKTNLLLAGESPLEALLPPKEHTDELVLFYIENMEQIHRVIHIPTFNREYTRFWVSGETRSPAMTALVLSTISISTCIAASAKDSGPITAKYRAMPVQWISACDEWLRQQSSKHRKLVHYQISCLLYLSKRINIIRKKKWWNETGSLIQNAIIDGLHLAPSPIDSPYLGEMKRRIWAALREIDLQSSFEYGLPTLLHNIESNIGAPANVDDMDFDEASKVLPTAKPPNVFTNTSYQSQSSYSWPLRLKVSRRLFSTGFTKVLVYEDVLLFTHELTQAMSLIPPWDSEGAGDDRPSRILTYAYLQFQIKTCILAIHRPYLQRGNTKYWMSENICSQMSRDILLLNIKLEDFGMQRLTFLGEGLLIASLTLARITLLQPKGSNNIIMSGSDSPIDLIEKCLPFMEDRYMRCFCGEPWCFMTLCASLMLLKIHAGKETMQTAKSLCAQKFLHLHYRHLERQTISSQTDLHAHNGVRQLDNSTASQRSPFVQESGQLDTDGPDITFNIFDFDMNLNDAWDMWGSEWPVELGK